ncbi:hypothetical protein GOV08_04025 [Candidatus Woesearchaeota archaeon]|nr:hypothetical protein [Candidatus Woesearchaeota archaeon]
MNQKQIGVIVLIIGVILSIFVYSSKVREDQNIELVIKLQNGSCYLEDGTCLHQDRDFSLFIIGAFMSIAMIVLGLYLLIFDKTQVLLAKQQVEVSAALKDAKTKEKKTNEFEAFLSGFNSYEKKVIRTINSQEGILQSTLRFKIGMSKTALSLLLSDLEKRKIISRKKKGKTNQVYLIKKF